MKDEPLILEGAHVRLEPMESHHADALADVGLSPELWQWTPSRLVTLRDMRVYVDSARADAALGTAVPFVTLHRASGRVVGSTRFGNIDRANRRVEVGWTWIGLPWQRSVVNTEAKFLMLRHAFEAWGVQRVELKTDALNLRSRQAIRRLGAIEEGTLRRHTVTGSGRVRDTVYFSILDDEWPVVRDALLAKLARSAAPSADDGAD